MVKLMLITNHVDIATFVAQCGVDRIFVDLEILGKKERQGHLNTVISQHSMDDVIALRRALPKTEILVRLNPYHHASHHEIEQAIIAGANLLMLPMFTQVQELEAFCRLVNGRVGVVPLLETKGAMETLDQWIKIPGISEIYIGLNDLHLDLKMDFIFEPLANGMVEQMAMMCNHAKIPFGIGGIARLGEGLLTPELILAEHVRLKSASVILSRTFHRCSTNLQELQACVDFEREITKIREFETKLHQRTAYEINADHQALVEKVKHIADNMRQHKSLGFTIR